MPFGLEFDRQIRLEFHGTKVTSDTGLFPYRELDERLNLSALSTTYLEDSRKGKNSQHSMKALLRQSVFSRIAGYVDTNDGERLRYDPCMRRIVGERAKIHWLHLEAQSVVLKRNYCEPMKI